MLILSRRAGRLLPAALVPLAAACSEAPPAKFDGVVIVRGGAVAALATTPAPLRQAIAPFSLAGAAESWETSPEPPFDFVADTMEETAQVEARLRDPYRVEDSILMEEGAATLG